MGNLIELAPTIAVFVVAMGVLLYIAAILMAAFGPALPGSVSERLRAWFVSGPSSEYWAALRSRGVFFHSGRLATCVPAGSRGQWLGDP